VYLVPDDAQAEKTMKKIFTELAHGQGHNRALQIHAREIKVLRRAPGIVWFDFSELCNGPRSQNDYLELAHNFHTVLLSHLPKINANQANAARRFTWLVDICYDHQVKLIISAACQKEQLYLNGVQSGEFKRVISRLQEMSSTRYLTIPHRRYETHAEIP